MNEDTKALLEGSIYIIIILPTIICLLLWLLRK